MKSLKFCTLFFCFFISCQAYAKPLKVQTIFRFTHSGSEEDFASIMMPLLESKDIKFVDKNPDVVLLCGAKNIEKFSFQHPTIILDQGEPASIRPSLRKALNNKHVKGIFKNTTLRPKRLYDIKFRYHYHFVNRKKVFPRLKPLHDDKLEKIQTVLWDLYRSPFRRSLWSLTQDPVNFSVQRHIDASFAGTFGKMSKSGKTLHRIRLVQKLESINNNKIFLHIGRLPLDQYIGLLKNSKIAISPWGTAEWCWRDYEAIYCGAVLIKPNSDFVKTDPDFYQSGKHYIACNPDFSDLEEKIAYVLRNYEKCKKMTENARKLLINSWNYERIATRLAMAIHNAARK